jgi:transposase
LGTQADCADGVRKQELKRLKHELPKAEYDLLKGLIKAFRKQALQLKDGDWVVLRRFFDNAPKAEQAYSLREELTDIFEGAYTKARAKCAIQAWCKRVRNSALTQFESFLTTVDNWLDESSNYFLEGLTSGFVEGFNNRVKVLKRRYYGIFKPKHLFQRLTLDLNGYQRFAPVHHI